MTDGPKSRSSCTGFLVRVAMMHAMMMDETQETITKTRNPRCPHPPLSKDGRVKTGVLVLESVHTTYRHAMQYCKTAHDKHIEYLGSMLPALK